MQIVVHIGANATDSDRLLRSLMRSSDALKRQGVAVPGPARYRKLLRETIQTWAESGERVPEGARETLLEAILDGAGARRIVLSNSSFICQPPRVFEGGQFYPMIGLKMRALAALFPGDEIEVHMGMRNPATFIPAVWHLSRGKSFEAFMAGLDPAQVRWSDMVARMRAAVPDIGITLWCNEDTPLVWDELLHRLAGVPEDLALEGAHDLLATIMAPEGMARYLGYLRSHPPGSAGQLRRVIGAFLDKYALPGEIEEEVDIPGWDAALVDSLTRGYEADVAAIAGRPDLRVVLP